MHIQVSEDTYAALTASQLGYLMKQRGEVKIKVRLLIYRTVCPVLGNRLA